MPDSPTPEPKSDFVCDSTGWQISACVGEPPYKDHEGKRYCVLHFPGKEKTADFEAALRRKLENANFDFEGVWFPDRVAFGKFEFNGDANFIGATFSGEADFSSTTFGAAVFFTSATFSETARFNGATFSAKANFSLANFSGEALFNGATFSAKANFKKATFRADSSFDSATFSAEAIFIFVTFQAKASFMRATFSARASFMFVKFRNMAWFPLATFSAKGDFGSATFSATAWFESATFSAKASFSDTTFSAAASFTAATFSGEAYFGSATFRGDADFDSVTFSALANFNSTTFADHVTFAGAEKQPVFLPTSRLDLQFARIERPDRVSLHTLSLRPHWFVNIDARKFGFANVNWARLSIDEEIRDLEKNLVSSPHPLLAIACRNLAVNAEENHRYEEASRFRYMAMEARLKSWRGFAPWRLSWWYWLASGYGERVLRAFLVLVALWVLFAVLYMTTGGWEAKAGVKPPTNFATALTYSAGVMTLQKPEPRAITPAAQTLVLLETILGPLQAALLALAIRRKFMR
jgi:hypothetical protein